MMKLTKHQLCQMLKNVRSELGVPNSKQTEEEILDIVFDALEVAPGQFRREYLLRENLVVYMDRYPVYASMQQGFKSPLVTRMHSNDLDCVVIVSDSVIKGKSSLFAGFCTDDRQSIMSLLEGLSFGLDALIREYKVSSDGDDSVFAAIFPLESILRF